MAKANTDVKAMEEIHNEDTTIDSAPILGNQEAIEFASDAAQSIIALFSTNDYACERIARQFVQSADYLLRYKSEDVTKQHAAVVEAEENISRGKAMAETEHARAMRLLEAKQNEERDLILFKRSMVDAYECATGKTYAPLPVRKQQNKQQTPAERLAALKARR